MYSQPSQSPGVDTSSLAVTSGPVCASSPTDAATNLHLPLDTLLHDTSGFFHQLGGRHSAAFFPEKLGVGLRYQFIDIDLGYAVSDALLYRFWRHPSCAV